jgi:hypothetical protein
LLQAEDKRDWRTILQDILEDIGIPSSDRHTIMLSINGVFGSANGRVKNSRNYSKATVTAACMQRFKDRNDFSDFSNHCDFEAFIAKRVQDLFQK